MKKIISLFAIVFMLSACASRSIKILDAEWTSMKHKSPPSTAQKLSPVRAVSINYCVDSWSGNYGLMDEAVIKAEAQYDLDYIKNPAFTQTQGKPNCMQLSGEGYRIAR